VGVLARQRIFTASPVDGEIIAGSPATIVASARVNLADPSGYFDLADWLLTQMPKTVLL
jgi:hypothetical protein